MAAAASGLGGFVAADPEPNEAEPNESAAEGATDSAMVGVRTGAAKGTAEAGTVLLQSALGALEAELHVHPLVPKGVAADCLP